MNGTQQEHWRNACLKTNYQQQTANGLNRKDQRKCNTQGRVKFKVVSCGKPADAAGTLLLALTPMLAVGCYAVGGSFSVS